MKLSILICSLVSRGTTFLPKLMAQINDQLKLIEQGQVEVLALTDNKNMSVGEKRNKLIDMSSGDYCIFVDDDDRISDDYISTILAATNSQRDVIVFDASVTVNGGSPKKCYYSINNRRNYDTPAAYHRLPNHITAVKTSIAKKVRFKDISFQEDNDYSVRLMSEIKTEHRIDKVLYFYDYSDYSSETVQYNVGLNRATVDMVILSKGDSRDKIAMTQNAIDTAKSNTIQNLNIFVIEQAPYIQYNNAQTIHKSEPFNYNLFANYGASFGYGDWIVIANNDLEFTKGWLEELLSANHDLVSPHEPNDYRQKGLMSNEIGKIVGRHMSGWCFMIKRTLFDQIGQFDTDVDFWCSDNVVVEQCSSVGVQPMIVKNSIVKHLGSQTLKGLPNMNDLTWKNVYIFNEKYGCNEFANNRGFAMWKAANQKLMIEIKNRYTKKIDVTVIVATFGSEDWKSAGDEAELTAVNAGVKTIRLHLDNGTLAQARNEALQKVDTEYVCFLDADDSLPIDYFNFTPKEDITATKISYSGNAPQRLYVHRHNSPGSGHFGRLCQPECLKLGNYIHIGAIIRTEIAKRIKFREYSVYEDWAYFLEQYINGATFGYSDSVYLAATRKNANHRNSGTPMDERNAVHAQIIMDLL